MKTVHEVSAVSGVSVRTLHHYDAIGLLKPTAVTAAGYRLYDDTALARLRDILLLRELEFPLREIGAILDSPDFDRGAALEQQLRLLEYKRAHIDRLIGLTRDMMKGETNMDFTAFDTSDMEQYAAEAKERWGNTAAYRESMAHPDADNAAAAAGLMAVFAAFGGIRDTDPASAEARKLVGELQDYITAHFYPCTDEILAGLGEMYTADERFAHNIDEAGGPGTATFVGAAIAAFCRIG